MKLYKGFTLILGIFSIALLVLIYVLAVERDGLKIVNDGLYKQLEEVSNSPRVPLGKQLIIMIDDEGKVDHKLEDKEEDNGE